MNRIASSGPRLSRLIHARKSHLTTNHLAPRLRVSIMASPIPPESAAPKPDTNEATKDSNEDVPLPKLTPTEFREYNSLAVRMDQFHNHFRSTWTVMSDACRANKRPRNMTMRQFIRLGQDFCRHLSMHHGIEETYVFPRLAVRMPKFRKELELLTQHKQIHAGVDRLEAYLDGCLDGTRELRLDELGEILDSFGDVLWEHLDEEVKELGAENMRKYWSLKEIREFQF